MKIQFVQKIMLAIAMMAVLTGCQTAAVNQTAYSSGGVRRAATATPTRFNASEVLRGQPMRPTSAALANLTEWGATNNTPYWLNYVGGGVMAVQATSPGEKIYFDSVNKWAWREKCHNPVVSYVPPTPPQEDVGQGQVVQNVTINQGPNPIVEFFRVLFGSVANVLRPDVNIYVAPPEPVVYRTYRPCPPPFYRRPPPQYHSCPPGYGYGGYH